MDRAAVLEAENTQLKEALQAQQALLKAQNERLDELVETLEQRAERIEHLEAYIRQLRHRQFGPSSEQSPDQLGLFDEPESDPADEPKPATPVRAHQRRTKGTPRISPDLPRVDVIHDLDPEEKYCSEHGCELEPMGEEVSEQLEFIPAHIEVKRHICKKYTCPACEGHVVTAKKPPQPIPKSMATASLLAWIVVSKYADAVPLYRQCECSVGSASRWTGRPWRSG